MKNLSFFLRCIFLASLLSSCSMYCNAELESSRESFDILISNNIQDTVQESFKNSLIENSLRKKKDQNRSTFSSKITKQLNQVINKAYLDENLIGVIAGIWVPGKGMWIKEKGLANVQNQKSIHFKDQVRIGSITKTFTTTILLQLVEEGLLSLDESIARFNTGIPNADQITVRELCNHTSGLYNYTSDPTVVTTLLADPLKVWTPRELIQIAIDHGPIAIPGTQVIYNNTNFIIQQVIIEQLTGKSLNKLIQQRIINPLNLRYTKYPVTPDFTHRFSHGYLVDVLDEEFADYTFVSPTALGGAGAIISNMHDLRVWAKALATGTLLSRKMQKERLTFVTPSPLPGPFQGPFVKYGLGIEKLGPFLGHQGDPVGYDCSMNYYPKHQAVFVVLLNRNPTAQFPNDQATVIFRELSKIIFPNEVPW